MFSENDILALLAAADTLSPRFKALTWRTLIGLLAATGMRPGEACHLTVSDIDLTNGVIQVLQTKFGKSRLVFIHPTTATVVARYLQARQEWVGTAARACPTVFVNSRRRALNPDTLGVTFKRIVAVAGLTTEPGRRPARLHDLRHTFAVTTMIDWYRDGQDVKCACHCCRPRLGHDYPPRRTGIWRPRCRNCSHAPHITLRHERVRLPRSRRHDRADRDIPAPGFSPNGWSGSYRPARRPLSAYRDTIKLLLMFVAQKMKKAPTRLTIDELDAVTVGAFLSYLDNERHNSTATHNARLAAIHSFYRYALPLIPDQPPHRKPGLGDPATPSRPGNRVVSDQPRDRRPPRGAGLPPPGTGAATTHCSSRPFRPGFVSRR